MAGRLLPIVLLCVANVTAAGEQKDASDRSLYRFEKRVTAHALGAAEPKLAAEAHFVGLLSTHSDADGQHVEEYTTGGLLSDLGEELPPRPAGDPIRRTFVLGADGDVTSPATRRGGLVVWSLPFEFLLMPQKTPPDAKVAGSGVRAFASHAAKPALRGHWAWGVTPEQEAQRAYQISGPCSGKFEGDFPLAGSLSRMVDAKSGALREAEAEISITIPVAARLAALADAPERKADEAQFFTGCDTIVVRESARMHEDDSSSPGAIELPGSLSTARAKLLRDATAP